MCSAQLLTGFSAAASSVSGVSAGSRRAEPGWSALNGGITRYGKWALLLSWLPIVGDPLTVAAGVMKEPLAHFVVLVAIAKITRYLAVAGVALNWA